MSLGLLVLIGWVAGIEVFLRIVPGWARMKVNTAVCFISAGACLWVLRKEQPGRPARLVGRGCALLITAIGALTLLEYVLGLQLGIDELLLRRPAHEAGLLIPARMSPITAVGFLMAGPGLLWLDRPTGGKVHPSDVSAVLIFLTGLLGLVGHLYSVEALYHVGLYSSMAIHTAIGSILLGIGMVSARPHRGLAAIFTRAGAGGILARRMLPTAILLPVILGWLRVEGQRAGYFELGFGTALFATSLVALFVANICWTAVSLERLDEVRAKAESAMRAFLFSRIRIRRRSSGFPPTGSSCSPTGRASLS